MAAGTLVSHGLMHAAGDLLGCTLEVAAYNVNYSAPGKYPDVNKLIEAHYAGYLATSDLITACRSQCVSIDPTLGPNPSGSLSPWSFAEGLWTRYYYAAQHRPTEGELLEIANRYFWTDDVLKSKLSLYGYIDADWREKKNNLRFDIPSPSDLVRFSVRHMWEPDLVSYLGYNDEFPGALIDVWHAMKGLDYPLFTGPFASQIAAMTGQENGNLAIAANYAEAGIPEPTWARGYWWSHWVLPSPGQFFDMLIRLDPARDVSFDSPEMVGKTFTLDDYRLGLRANDYPPRYRDLLAAINRPIPGIRFIRGLVDAEVYDYDNTIEWARRWGYSPRDQKDVADLIFLQSKGGKQKASACKGCAVCDEAFEIGIIRQADLQSCYEGYGATSQDAERMAQQAATKLQVKRLRELVSNVRKRFLRGALNDNQAIQLLQVGGVVMERVVEYVQDWQLELDGAVRQVSASQAVKYACQGLISELELRNRLTNLGFAPDAVDLQVAAATQCAGDLVLKSAEKAAKVAWQRQQQQYAYCRRARQVLQEQQRALAARGSPNQLQKWFCDGIIGEPEVYSRLYALSWDQGDITAFLSDCKSGRKPTRPYPAGEPVVIPECPVPQPP